MQPLECLVHHVRLCRFKVKNVLKWSPELGILLVFRQILNMFLWRFRMCLQGLHPQNKAPKKERWRSWETLEPVLISVKHWLLTWMTGSNDPYIYTYYGVDAVNMVEWQVIISINVYKCCFIYQWSGEWPWLISMLTGDSLNDPFHKWYLVGGIPTPLKNMSSSVGMMTFPYGKKMFQTTNQIFIGRC